MRDVYFSSNFSTNLILTTYSAGLIFSEWWLTQNKEKMQKRDYEYKKIN